MDALDAIERRIEQLNRIVGTPTVDDAAAATGTATSTIGRQPTENLTDSLASAQTLIASAMAGREKIADVVQRAAELEHMLDPAYLDGQQDAKAKEVYVNTVAPELAASFEQLEQIKKLEPALGAEYFRSIPDVSGQLHAMTEASAELGQRNELLEESMTLALQRYDEVQTGINRSLQELSERLDQLEQKLRAKRTKQRDAKEAALEREAEEAAAAQEDAEAK